jgi:hypothetical protein
VAFFKLPNLILVAVFNIKSIARALNCVGIRYLEVPVNAKSCAVLFVLLIVELTVVKAEVGRTLIANLSEPLSYHLIFFVLWEGSVAED